VGVADVGSNAIRLQVLRAGPPGAPPEVVEFRREPVRLGAGVFADGELRPEVLAEAARVLAAFRRRCARLGATRIRAVATAALRAANRADDALAQLRQASGIAVEILSGEEEARLLCRAVRSRVDLGRGRALLLDLGGGSLETTWVEDGRARAFGSHPLGVVAVLEAAQRRCGTDHGPALLAALEASAAEARAAVEPLFAGGRPERAVATGGSIDALARLAGWEPGPHGPGCVTIAALSAWIARLAPLAPDERSERFGLAPDRADVILPAAVLYRALAEAAGLDAILAAGVGLRDGVALELLEGSGGDREGEGAGA